MASALSVMETADCGLHTYTMYDKSTVFSGCSGKLGGCSSNDLLGTQWNDFFMEWPICLAGDFWNTINHVLHTSHASITVSLAYWLRCLHTERGVDGSTLILYFLFASQSYQYLRALCIQRMKNHTVVACMHKIMQVFTFTRRQSQVCLITHYWRHVIDDMWLMTCDWRHVIDCVIDHPTTCRFSEIKKCLLRFPTKCQISRLIVGVEN